MKLGFDIDGITANMAKAMVELINAKYNLNYDVNVFKDHNIHKNKYVEDPELNDEIAMCMRNEVIENPEAVVNLEVYEDGVEAIRRLSKSGHTIHHITSRPAVQHDATVEWLRNNFIPFDSVHVVGKSGIKGVSAVGKGRLGRSLNLDFYIDDQGRHLDDMYRYKNRWRKGLALYTRPWNLDEAIDSKMNRFDNWVDVIRHLGIQKR